MVRRWLLMFIGSIMVLVAAFREGVGWGVAVLFLSPIAPLLFVIMHWEEGRKGFFCQMVGIVLCGVAFGAVLATGLESTMADFEKAKRWAPIERVGLGADSGNASEAEPARKPGPTIEDKDRIVGRPLNEIKDELGPPLGTMKTGGRTILCYDGMDIVSADGETATSVVERGRE